MNNIVYILKRLLHMAFLTIIAPYFLRKINSNEKIGGNIDFNKEKKKKSFFFVK